MLEPSESRRCLETNEPRCEVDVQFDTWGGVSCCTVGRSGGSEFTGVALRDRSMGEVEAGIGFQFFGIDAHTPGRWPRVSDGGWHSGARIVSASIARRGAGKRTGAAKGESRCDFPRRLRG